jgi:hypothetical protein
MSVFGYINVHILKWPTERRPTEKKVIVTKNSLQKIFVTITFKFHDFCVLKSPAQTAFWTFIGTFSKVATLLLFGRPMHNYYRFCL